jgi:hypothetical protein
MAFGALLKLALFCGRLDFQFFSISELLGKYFAGIVRVGDRCAGYVRTRIEKYERVNSAQVSGCNPYA